MALSTLDSHLSTSELEADSPPYSSILPVREKYEPANEPIKMFVGVQTDIFGGVLPGNGIPGKGCGFPVPFRCGCCGEEYWSDSSCKQKACPTCYEKWAFQRGQAAADRFWMGKAYWYRGLPARALHIVVSWKLQEEGWTVNDYKRKCISILKRHGATGGLMIRHTMRKDEDEERQPDGCIHFHCVALVPGSFQAGGVPEDGGAVVKVVVDRVTGNYKGINKKRQLGRLVQYLLTHASVRAHEQTLTYFGLMAPNMMSQKTLAEEFPEAIEHIEERQKMKCPKCDSTDIEPLRGILRELYANLGFRSQAEFKNFTRRFPRPIEAALLFKGRNRPLDDEQIDKYYQRYKRAEAAMRKDLNLDGGG